MSRRNGKMSSALQLDRRFRWSLYAAFALLFATGAAWLLADQLKDSADGEFWQATTANVLMVHGGVAMLTLLLLGALFPIHIARAWRGRLNRVSGSIMVVCNAVLILTAFGLYYLGAETLRPWASDAHSPPCGAAVGSRSQELAASGSSAVISLNFFPAQRP